MFLLLDGLDEYAGNNIELATFVEGICTKRTRQVVQIRRFLMPGIEMEALNFPGILAFADETFSGFWTPSEHAGSEDLKDIAWDIANRASGVFLWARFAVFEMIEGKTRGEQHNELHIRLENIPPELEEIYSRIFNNRSSSEKAMLKTLLQLLCSAQQTLLLGHVFSAMSMLSAQDNLEQQASFLDDNEILAF